MLLCLVSCKEPSVIDIPGPENVMVHRFPFQVSTSAIGGDTTQNLETDWAVLIMPKTSLINPVRLVVYCHSGGGIVTEQDISESEKVDITQYLVSKGYAVLDVGGLPMSYANRLNVDPGRTVGSYVALRSMLKAYDYVTEQFNIAKDGCFLMSNSNGGLLASNIVNLSDMPVLAQSGLAPLISLERNTWFVESGAVHGGGFTSYQNRANIARLFGMQCSLNTQEELLNAKYEKEKVGVYDPFDYCVNQSKEPYRVPYLIFTLKDDKFVYYDLTQEFAQKMNERGSKIVLSDIDEYGAHNVIPKPVILGDFVYGVKKPLKLTVKTIGDYFDSYNPDL